MPLFSCDEKQQNKKGVSAFTETPFPFAVVKYQPICLYFWAIFLISSLA